MTINFEQRRKAFLRYAGWAFFYFHLFLFIGINSLLIAINLKNDPQNPWFIIPLTCWGLFLIIHFLILFFIDSHSARKWRESRIDPEVIDKLNLGLTNEQLFRKTMVKSFSWMIFYLHLGLYCGGSLVMVLINYFVAPKFWWSVIALVSWLFWLLTHYAITYISFGEKIADWRTNKIKGFIYKKDIVGESIYKEATIYFGFWLALKVHIFLYLFTNLFLIWCDFNLNISTKHWFYYPLLSWGIFLLAHWLVTFLIISPQLAKWRENRVFNQLD